MPRIAPWESSQTDQQLFFNWVHIMFLVPSHESHSPSPPKSSDFSKILPDLLLIQTLSQRGE